MSKTISVSDAVAKALAGSKRTADELLRDALKIKAEGLETAEGVTFSEGSDFLAWYKGRPYWGVVKNGALEIKSERFTSVSSAAGKITGRPTNGWDFWQCKAPGQSEFVRISALRKNGGSHTRKIPPQAQKRPT